MEWQRLMEWMRQWDMVLVIGALLIVCMLALFLRWFLRLDEIAKTLREIHEELRLLRHTRDREGPGAPEEEKKYYLE